MTEPENQSWDGQEMVTRTSLDDPSAKRPHGANPSDGLFCYSCVDCNTDVDEEPCSYCYMRSPYDYPTQWEQVKEND